MSKSDSLIKNTAILSIGTMCTKVLSFIVVPIFSAWLSSEDYGTFDLLTTYVTLAIPFITLSSGEALFRFLIDCRNNRDKSNVITNISKICVVGLIIAFAILSIGYCFFRSESILSFAILLLTEIVYTLSSFMARGLKKLKEYAIASVVFTVTMCISVSILIKIAHLNLLGMVLGYGIAYGISSVYLILKCRPFKYINLEYINPNTQKEVLKYSLPLIPNTISWWINNVSDRTIIRFVLGASFNGVYAIANKIPAICTAIFSVFHLSWQENASESVNDNDREVYFNNVYNTIVPTLISICMCVLSVNGLLFRYIFDPKYNDAKLQVPILITAIIISFVAQFYGGIFIAFKEPKINGLTTLIAAAINFLINIVFIRCIGLFAASISTLISYLTIAVIRKIVLNKRIKLVAKPKSLLSIFIYLSFLSMEIIIYVYDNRASIICEYALILFSITYFMFLNIKYVNKYAKRFTTKK